MLTAAPRLRHKNFNKALQMRHRRATQMPNRKVSNLTIVQQRETADRVKSVDTGLANSEHPNA
jgi:hypothetical protein